jgi:hypothetical protein
MTYATAITQLASTLGDISGIYHVYQDPPESIPEMPCFVLSWNSGQVEWLTNNLTREEATLWAVLYLNRQILPVASSATRAYIQSFRDAIDGVRDLSDAVFNILRWRWEGPAAVSFADQFYLGIRFEIDVLLVSNIA